jgi:hypothetical protein
MRPAIKAGLLMIWRDRDTLQIGIDPRRAIALTGMSGTAPLISLLDGSRDHTQVLAEAQDRGISRDAADRVIGLLTAAGALHDFPAAALRALPDGPRARLAGELATASLAHGYADGGARVLARRQAASVLVRGTGPVGSCLASLLAASGVGQVTGTGPVDQAAPPAGVPARPDARRASRRPSRTARGTSVRDYLGSGRQPDLVVLAGGWPPELPAALVAEHVAHLAAAASEAIGVVGPLVVPGQSACLGCVDLARADRDPAWPVIVAQVAGRDPQPAACAAALATAVAAQAATQALAFIDQAGPATAVTNGTLELVLPGWQWRRRSWLPHRQCRCSRRPATCPRM